MLEMKHSCEQCAANLPADLDGAYICSFECTFCQACASEQFGFRCPNCGGVLIERPTRVGDALRRHPAAAPDRV